jgi:hypothetical protein
MAYASRFAASAIFWLMLYVVVPAAIPYRFTSLEVPAIQWIAANLIMLMLFLGNCLLLSGCPSLPARLFPVAIWLLYGIADKLLGPALLLDPSKPMLDRMNLASSALVGIGVFALAATAFIGLRGSLHSNEQGRGLSYNIVIAIGLMIISSHFVLITFFGSHFLRVIPYEVVVYGFGYVLPLYYVLSLAIGMSSLPRGTRMA